MITRIIVAILINGLGLYASTKIIPGFTAPTDLQDLLVAAIVFAAINLLIKPIVNLVMSPIIFITFGIATIVINGAMLYLLDYLLPTVTIAGLEPLIYATLLISVINVTFGVAKK